MNQKIPGRIAVASWLGRGKVRRMSEGLRSIPSVERVLQALGPGDLPRLTITAVVRRELAIVRDRGEVPPFESILAQVREALSALASARLRPVVNATGILVHTNLGRAP
jgi:L-seryl-tRNA(Ser) seleniumtransferase